MPFGAAFLPHGADEFEPGFRSVYRMAAPAPKPLLFEVRGPIERSDLPGLCDRVCALLQASPASVAFCEVGTVAPDAVTVDALARLQLGAQRRGCRVRLLHASDELRELVAFMGLADVLPE